MATDDTSYTEIANKEHVSTYALVLTLIKWTIIATTVVLLGLLAVCKA